MYTVDTVKKQLLSSGPSPSTFPRFFAYGPQTANLAEVFMSMVVAQCVAVKTGEWSHIWKPKPLNPGCIQG